MSNLSPQNTYHQNRIKTAGQSELIVMLYDAAIRNLQTAVEELKTEKPRIDIVNNAFNKASGIIAELSASLNFEQGGEIADQQGGEIADHLFNLYCFFGSEITKANIHKEIGSIPKIIEMLEDLRRAWKIAASDASAAPAGRYEGLSING